MPINGFGGRIDTPHKIIIGLLAKREKQSLKPMNSIASTHFDEIIGF
jgi:hypothetical protein